MFKTFKLLFNSKNKDIRKRVLFTLGCLFIFIIGKTIPVPGTQGAISKLNLWGCDLDDVSILSSMHNLRVISLSFFFELVHIGYKVHLNFQSAFRQILPV